MPSAFATGTDVDYYRDRVQSPAQLPRGFAFLWAGTLVSFTGDGIVRIAMPLLATSLTDDSVAIGGLAAATQLPWLLFGVKAGRMVDASHPVRAMMRADLLRATALCLLGVAVVADRVSIPALFAVALVLGIGDVIFSAGSGSLVPEMVPDDLLPKANSRIEVAETIGEAGVGPPAGGWLYSLGQSVPLLFDAASFFVSFLCLFKLRDHVTATAAPPTEGTKRGGLRWYLSQRPLRTLTAYTMCMAATQAMVWAILVVLVVDERGRSATLFGVFSSVTSLGAVAGGLAADRVWSRLGTRVTLASAFGVTSAGYLAAGGTSSLWVAMVCLFVVSSCAPVGNVVTLTMRQRLAPSNMRGEVNNTFRLFVLGSVPLGALLGGAVAAWSDASTSIFAAGILLVLLAAAPTLGIMRSPAFGASSTA